MSERWRKRAEAIVTDLLDYPEQRWIEVPRETVEGALIALALEVTERCAKALDHWEGTGDWLRNLDERLEWEEGLREALGDA